MKVNASTKTAGWILTLVGAFWLYFVFAADYGDNVASGTYVSRTDGETSTLVLKADHTFHQERTRDGKLDRADGTWRRIGEGGLVFSKDFLVLPRQRTRADGTADGDLYKTLGLWPYISLDSAATGPLFRKKLLP